MQYNNCISNVRRNGDGMTSTKLFDKQQFKKKVVDNCKVLYRKNIDEANEQQVFQSVAYAVKDIIIRQ